MDLTWLASMVHKIQQRLFLFISAGALLAISGLFGIQLGLRHGFLDYLNMDEESDLSAALIQTYHHEGNSWAFLKKDSSTWPERLELALPHAEIADRLIFFDAEHNPIRGHVRLTTQ